MNAKREIAVVAYWFEKTLNHSLSPTSSPNSSDTGRQLADDPHVGDPAAEMLAVYRWFVAAPLARAGLIGDLVVDAKSGVSGAGRDPKPEMMFGEVNESVRAYGIDGHRHVAEIEQELATLGSAGATENPGASGVDFLPHLIPMTRGILAACHVRPTRAIDQAELDSLYRDAYAGEPFVDVMPAGSHPDTRSVRAANMCRIAVHRPPQGSSKSDTLVILSVIDNLTKGAAGQAVQNMNLMFGLAETTGLAQPQVVP